MGDIFSAENIYLAIAFFGAAVCIAMLVCLVMYLISYVPCAIGQRRMSIKCGIDKPWMAFIPVESADNLGCIAEKYDDGKPTVEKYSKKLFWLNDLAIMSGALIGGLGFWLFMMIGVIFYIYETHDVDEYILGTEMIIFSAVIAVILLLYSLIKVYIAFRAEALLRVYSIFAPEKAKRFLVLSVFVPLAMPFIMLSISLKEPLLMRRDDMSGANVKSES